MAQVGFCFADACSALSARRVAHQTGQHTWKLVPMFNTNAARRGGTGLDPRMRSEQDTSPCGGQGAQMSGVVINQNGGIDALNMLRLATGTGHGVSVGEDDLAKHARKVSVDPEPSHVTVRTFHPGGQNNKVKTLGQLRNPTNCPVNRWQVR
jgi:hypothetical protein